MASLVITVRNEERTIGTLMRSIVRQTEKPDEIVIVDGNSSDKTASIVQEYIQKNPDLTIRLLSYTGNIAQGRNFGISHAKHDVIAITDAGCTLHKDWFRLISQPILNNKADVVAGYYIPTGSSIFQKCLATYTSVMPDKLNPKTFLPSSRSIAFKRKAWKEVGGYPEYLETAEDLVFAKKLWNSGRRCITVPSAIVYWAQKKTLLQAAKQFFRYAKGDGKALYIRYQTPLLFGRYCVGCILILMQAYVPLLLLTLGYGAWAIAKNYAYVRHYKALIYLPVLQITADISVMSGMMVGFIQRLIHSEKNNAAKIS